MATRVGLEPHVYVVLDLLCYSKKIGQNTDLKHNLLIMSLVVRKPAFCICKNKDADQLRGNREADQCLCFCYIDSTIPLLPKYKISRL